MPGKMWIKCVPCFFCVLGSLISVVYFFWHEPFLFNLVNLVDICSMENILWTAFNNWLTPSRTLPAEHRLLPKLKSVVLLFILKDPEWQKASCLQELTLPKGGKEKLSLCFNEIRDVVDVNQTETCSSSSLVSKNKDLWVMYYSTWK